MTTLSLARIIGDALIALKGKASDAHCAASPGHYALKRSVISGCRAKQIATAGTAQKETIMPDNWKQQANAHFRTPPETGKHKTVISDSEAGAAAVAANTVRLKGLRLARDAAEQAAPREAVPGKKPGSKK